MGQATIDRGSTLWNKGNPELCGAIYAMTVSRQPLLCSAPEARTLAAAGNISASVQDLAATALIRAEPYPVARARLVFT